MSAFCLGYVCCLCSLVFVSSSILLFCSLWFAHSLLTCFLLLSFVLTLFGAFPLMPSRIPCLRLFMFWCCAGMLAALDEGIGNITETLRMTGMTNNTILVLSNDNGEDAYRLWLRIMRREYMWLRIMRREWLRIMRREYMWLRIMLREYMWLSITYVRRWCSVCTSLLCSASNSLAVVIHILTC